MDSTRLSLRKLSLFLKHSPLPDDVEDFLEDGKWKCNSCGCCCAFVSWFDIPTDEHGICSHLGKDRQCTIYEKRPKQCVVHTDQITPLAQAKTCSWLRSNYNSTLVQGGY